MFKQIVALITISIAMTMTMAQSQHAIQLLVIAHDWISQILTEVFSGGQIGNMIRSLIALMSIPVLVASIPSLVYWLIKRHWFPYFMPIVWIVWLVQVGALIIMYKAL